MEPSKALCLLLSFTILLSGCYSQSALTQEELASIRETVVFSSERGSYDRSAPASSPVYFYLKDWSYIKAEAGNARRLDDGFQVLGRVFRGGRPLETWRGVVQDTAIQAMTTYEIETFTLVFYLHDGTFVVSRPSSHGRSGAGYRVSGDRYRRGDEKGGRFKLQEAPFAGVIGDSAIRKITTQDAMSDEKMRFTLLDGSYVESEPSDRIRLETGYLISGGRYQRVMGADGDSLWQVSPFRGVIEDSDIQAITLPRLSVATKVALAILAVGLIVGMVALFKDMPQGSVDLSGAFPSGR